MYMNEINYKSPASSPTEEASFSDVENFAVSPEDNKIDVVNVEQLSVTDRNLEKEVKGDESRTWTMAKVQVGYDVTRKGERSLVVDGFKFTKSRDGTNNRVFWRCSRRECKATAVTVCDKVEHVRAIHAHEPPLAAEFFGNHEGVSQHCELQEVRFNTNAANMRPRYRRSNISMSESNPEYMMVKDISNSNNNLHKNSTTQQKQKSYSIKTENSPHFRSFTNDSKPTFTVVDDSPKTPSVKDQVRDFILRNSSQINSYPQNNGVSVAQFLISPTTKTPFVNNSVPSPTCNSSAVFNFNPTQLNAFSNNSSNSISDISSHKSTPGLMTVPPTPHEDNQIKLESNDHPVLNQVHVDQIIQMLLKRSNNKVRSSSDSEWSSPTLCPEAPQMETSPHSPSIILSSGVNDGYHANATSRFVHWKKERLRESELRDQMVNDRKRRCEDYGYDDPELYQDSVVNNRYSSAPNNDSKKLCSFLNNFRPTITQKLMGVMQKLTSELCPEDAIAQEVYEKCTAIKTCLETLEKLHSLTSL